MKHSIRAVPRRRSGLPDRSTMASLLAWAAPIALCIAGAVRAQSPLTTTFARDNSGAIGGMVYFDLDVVAAGGVTITAIDCNTEAAAGTLQLWLANAAGGYVAHAAQPASWTPAASGQFVGAGRDQPTRACLSPAVWLPPGSYAVALSGEGLAHEYTSGGPGIANVFQTAELTLTAGAASHQPFGGVQYAPRIWNGSLHYEPGQTSGLQCARSAVLGAGCIDGAASFYEDFDSLQTFDLHGGAPVTLHATALGEVGYLTQVHAGAFAMPQGAPLHGRNSSAPMADDEVSVALALPFAFPLPTGASITTVHATSNGYVLLGPSAAVAADLLPTPGELLGEGPRLCPLWCDLHAAANLSINPHSGVYFDVAADGSSATITWLDVGDGRAGTPAPGSTSIDVQCVMYTNGDFAFCYGSIAPGPGTGRVLVGVSAGVAASGRPARDPGSVDLDAAPAVTSGPDSFPLLHTCSLARLGDAIELAVHDAEDVTTFAVLAAGRLLAQPMPDLASYGAPDCSALVADDITFSVPLSFPGGVIGTGEQTGVGTHVLAVPTDTALLGVTFASQFAALCSRNAYGLTTSNAMLWTVGR